MGAALCREGAILLSALVGVGVFSLSGVGECDSCCSIAVVGLCLLPVYAPKDLCLCCERLPLGSFLAVTPCGFSAVLFCANLRLDVCLSQISVLLPAPDFSVFGAVAVVGAADFCAAFWAMPHLESLPDFSQIALRSHSFFQFDFSVLLRGLPSACVAAVP